MSVAATGGPSIRQLGRQLRDDKLGTFLPIAIWYGELEATSDGTLAEMLLSLSAPLAVSAKYVWSLEEIHVKTDSATATTGRASFTIGDVTVSGGSSRMESSFLTVIIPAVLGGTIRGLATLNNDADGASQALTRRLYVPSGTTPFASIVEVPNIIGEIWNAQWWGYLWSKGTFDEGLMPVRPA